MNKALRSLDIAQSSIATDKRNDLVYAVTINITKMQIESILDRHVKRRIIYARRYEYY